MATEEWLMLSGGQHCAIGNEVLNTEKDTCMYVCIFFFVYLQHVPLKIAILHASKDHRTRFTLYTFPSYFRLIRMAVCILFAFLDL